VPKATKFSRLTFGQAVRRERERIDLSQEDFAEKANVHRTYISSVELGKVSVGIEVANSLAVALGVRLSQLISRAERYPLSMGARSLVWQKHLFLPHAFGFNSLRTCQDLQGSIRAGFCRATRPCAESSAPIPLARVLRRATSAPVRAERQSWRHPR
jgi:transcriptional regulator with XRE-family HTH domain